MVKVCKDGRIQGQTNKEAGDHLGILSGHRHRGIYKYIKKGRNPNQGFQKGNRPWNKGTKGSYKLSEKRRKKISESLKGEKNPNWKGGITPRRKAILDTLEYKIWRKSVFERDGFRCIVCGETGGELNAHHIKKSSKFPELRFEISNGITMCVKCHRLTDNWGNKKSTGGEVNGRSQRR